MNATEEALYQIVAELRQLNQTLAGKVNLSDVPIEDLGYLTARWIRRNYRRGQRRTIYLRSVLTDCSLFQGNIYLARRVLDYLADNDILDRSKVTRDEYVIQWENLNEETK